MMMLSPLNSANNHNFTVFADAKNVTKSLMVIGDPLRGASKALSD